jgi:hypothetical protein
MKNILIRVGPCETEGMFPAIHLPLKVYEEKCRDGKKTFNNNLHNISFDYLRRGGKKI